MQNVSWTAVLVVAAAAAGALAPATAHAGSYDVWSCRGPDGGALAAGAWSAGGQDTCAAGGSLRLTAASGYATLRFTPPPGTRISGYELWRSLQVADEWRDGAAAVIETAGTSSFVVDGCPFTRGCRSLGDPTEPLAAVNRVVAGHAPLDALTLLVACDWKCDADTRIDLYRSRVTIDDQAAPTVAGAAVAGDSLTVSAADRGGGVAAVTAAFDGGAARTAASGCAPPYAAAAPCPAQVDRAFSLAGLAPGAHRASGTVVDAAGNATPWGPVAFTVVSAPVRVVGAGSAPAAPHLSLASTSVVHAAGAPAHLHGTLTDAAGVPIAGASVGVSFLDLGADRATPRVLAPVTTDAAGAFTVTLRRDGAQRVTVAYGAAQATATVRSPIALHLRSNRGRLVKGRVVELRGRLSGAGPSAHGAVVVIESIVDGRWQPVGSARAGASGRYVWRYRFVHLRRDTIFSFRAVVVRQPGWPWASPHSSTVKVRVDVP
jgi:hypothetical protein